MKWMSKTFVGILFAILSFQVFAQNLSVLQGATDETSTQFSILVPANSHYVVSVEGRAPQWAEQVEYEGSEWSVLKFGFKNLNLGQVYDLKVSDDSGTVLDIRQFQTLDRRKRYQKIVLASCMVDWLHNRWNWQQMQGLAPDMIVLLGDAAYVDVKSPRSLILRPKVQELDHWKRFVESRQTLDLYHWKKLVPVIAGMDDHDFGYNNADSSFALKNQSNFTFETFFAQTSKSDFVSRGPGQSYKWDMGDVSYVILDGRNFRDGTQIFSDEQIDWLKKQKFKPRTLLMTGGQFFGAYLNKDSFEGNYNSAFQVFLKELKSFPTQFVFGSGDVHFSELMEIEKENLGYKTFEITSSSVHSFTVPGAHLVRRFNPRRIPGRVTSTHNFVTIDFNRLRPHSWTVRSHGWRGQNLFESQFDFEPYAAFNSDCSNLLTGN